MSILISGSSGIDMGNLPVSNASQVEVQDNQVSPFGGFKNYIINGNFDVSQRGAGETNKVVGISSNPAYMADCVGIVGALAGKLFNWSLSTDVPLSDFSNSINFGATTADTTIYLVHRIENVRKLSGKTCTLSFWAKVGIGSINIPVGLQQMFGSGGSGSVNLQPINLVKTANLSTTWTKFSFTFNVPSTSGKTIGASSYLEFNAGIANTTQGFFITGVQLEEGSIATPFEQRPYALELSLCKRYARDIGNSSLYGQIGNGFAMSTTSALIEIDVNDMRIVPIISNTLTANLFEIEYANGAGTSRVTCTAIAINSSATANSNKLNLMITVGGGLTTGQCVGFRNNNTSTNKIILSAEL